MDYIDWLESGSILAAAARAVIGFIFAWALFKLGKKRFLGRRSAFDALIVIVVGAVLGRGIAEGADFIASLAAGATIMAAHTLFAWVAVQHPRLARIVEGHERVLVRDGVIDHTEMRRALLTEADLLQAMRVGTGETDISRIRSACQEKSGEISLTLKPEGAP